MNYKESGKILDLVNKVQKVVITCHHGPDLDSIASCLSLFWALKNLGKEVEVLTPSPIYDQALFLPGAKEIKLIDLRKYDFSKFDLMIVPDAGTWDVIINSKKEKTPPKIPIVTIDH